MLWHAGGTGDKGSSGSSSDGGGSSSNTVGIVVGVAVGCAALGKLALSATPAPSKFCLAVALVALTMCNASLPPGMQWLLRWQSGGMSGLGGVRAKPMHQKVCP